MCLHQHLQGLGGRVAGRQAVEQEGTGGIAGEKRENQGRGRRVQCPRALASCRGAAVPRPSLFLSPKPTLTRLLSFSPAQTQVPPTRPARPARPARRST